MRHVTKHFAFVLLFALASLASIPAVSSAAGPSSPLMPPQSNAFGKSLEQWNVLQTRWAIALGLGDPTGVSDQVGRVRLLPGEFFDPAPQFHMTLAPGTPFVAAPFFLHGERYDDAAIPDDDPVALKELLDLILGTAQVRIVLDGRVLLEGSGSQLQEFLFGPTYFDIPIPYDDPQPRGDGLNAVAALWVTGIGAMYRPLPAGEHTLVYDLQSLFGNFLFTYHITVAPK
jgi:hypothetical protein